MENNTEEKKRCKLASRKFWVTIIVIAAAVIYGLHAMGVEGNQILTWICMACTCIAGVAYVIAEAMVDTSYEEIEEEEQG